MGVNVLTVDAWLVGCQDTDRLYDENELEEWSMPEMVKEYRRARIWRVDHCKAKLLTPAYKGLQYRTVAHSRKIFGCCNSL